MKCLCKFTFQASHLLSTSAPKSDIDSAAKFIGAGEKSVLKRIPLNTFDQVPPPWVLLDPALELAPFLAPSSSAMPGETVCGYKIWYIQCLNSQSFSFNIMCRNPSLKQQLFSYAILGFALSEAMGLFCLMMAFLLLFAF